MLHNNWNVVRGWRRAEIEDFSAIEDLMAFCEDDITSLYNAPRTDHLIEKSYFPIVQLDDAGKILSFTAYKPYPNIPSVPSFCWIEWIREKYKLEDVNSRNSLFIHFMVWHSAQKKDFFQLLLETTFLEFPHLRYIILVKPPLAQTPEIYTDYFIPTLPNDLRDENDVYSVQSINICHRHSLIEPLRFRKAMAEDSDVLMSLFKEKQIHDLEKFYGEYFLAELLQFPGVCERHVLVCEYEGIAAGIISVNLCVDLDFLNQEFELVPFNGLRKVNENDFTSCDLSLGSMDFHDRDMVNMLRSQDIQLLNTYSLDLDSSIIEWKRDKSSSSSDSSYEIDFPMINVTSSLRQLIGNVEELPSSENLRPVKDFENENIYITVDDSPNDGIEALRNRNFLSIGTAQKLFLPRYNGPSNAFAIEIFAVDNDKINEKLSIDFLEAAFALAPDRDYCILTIPTHLLPIPLLNHFIRVSHKPTKKNRHELYICHKSYFSGSSVSVKPLERSDLEEIKVFLHKIYNSSVIYTEFQDSLVPGSLDRGYALVVEKSIVGLALIRLETFLADLQLYFDFDDISILDLHDIENRSMLRHLLLSPPFHAFGRFFLLDIMRLADVTCFFHLLSHEAKLSRSIVSLLGDLIALKPRKPIRPGIRSSVSTDIISKSLNFEIPFALFFTNAQICSRLKLDVNKIIVVIGASMTATSFFENIIFGSSRSHICYNNLIWISAHGTRQDLPENEVRDLLFPVRNKYDKDYLAMLSLKSHVNFIHGVMTGINRDEKYVVLDRSAIVKYDVLILTLGLQFLRPVPEVKKKKFSTRRNKFPKSSLSRFLTKGPVETESDENVHPVNMFLINTYLEAENTLCALKYVKNQIESGAVSDKKIIVYGHNIRVFLMLHALLKLGIPGKNIAFVEPFPSREISITVFGDICIDREVINTIKKCEIQHYPEYFLYDWAFSASNRLASITFHSSNSQVTLQCLAFIPLVHKLASDVNFNGISLKISVNTERKSNKRISVVDCKRQRLCMAADNPTAERTNCRISELKKESWEKISCNDAGLLYDGKLVIDSTFKTNDRNIFAAGPFTKYPRRYYAHEDLHQYYSSVEVGKKLAEFVEQEIDPDENFVEVCGVDMVPSFEEPVMIYCQLPGDFYYFSLRKPGKPVDFESAFNHRVFGDVLVTGDCQMSKGSGYFRLHLDQAGCVQGIICFTTKEIDYINLYSLYGLNEKLLNNLLVRYDCGMIPDFYEYFRQPWADAIFHYRFPSLTEYNVKRLKETVNLHPREPEERKVTQNPNSDIFKPFSETTKKKIELEYQNSGVKTEIQRNVVEFLNYFDKELTRYATPNILRELFLKDQAPKDEDRRK